MKDLDHSGKPDGAMVLMKKSDRDVDMWHGATKKKALRKKAVKKAGNVKHSADTFATFSQLEIPAPVTYDDVKVLIQVWSLNFFIWRKTLLNSAKRARSSTKEKAE